MELAPGLAVAIGVVSAPIAASLAYRLLAGRWNWVRPRLDRDGFFNWAASVIVGFMVLYYVPLILGPKNMPEKSRSELWGSWFDVWVVIVAASAVLLILVTSRLARRVDWCSGCYRSSTPR